MKNGFRVILVVTELDTNRSDQGSFSYLMPPRVSKVTQLPWSLLFVLHSITTEITRKPVFVTTKKCFWAFFTFACAWALIDIKYECRDGR
jgi:hypothetical protein